MRASYESIDNKQKMCEKVNKDITFIQFFHSTRLHWTIQNILLAANSTTAFLQKASRPGKNINSVHSYPKSSFLVLNLKKFTLNEKH